MPHSPANRPATLLWGAELIARGQCTDGLGERHHGLFQSLKIRQLFVADELQRRGVVVAFLRRQDMDGLVDRFIWLSSGSAVAARSCSTASVNARVSLSTSARTSRPGESAPSPLPASSALAGAGGHFAPAQQRPLIESSLNYRARKRKL
jgi:hypothetical protein